MKKSTIVLALASIGLAGTAFGFDGNRRGFVLGGGFGLAQCQAGQPMPPVTSGATTTVSDSACRSSSAVPLASTICSSMKATSPVGIPTWSMRRSHKVTTVLPGILLRADRPQRLYSRGGGDVLFRCERILEK